MKRVLSPLLVVLVLTGCHRTPDQAPVPAPEKLSKGYGAPAPAPIEFLPEKECEDFRQALAQTDQLRHTLENCIRKKDFHCDHARLKSSLSSIELRMGNGAGITPNTGEARVHLYMDHGSGALRNQSIQWVRYPQDGSWHCFTQGLARRAGVHQAECS